MPKWIKITIILVLILGALIAYLSLSNNISWNNVTNQSDIVVEEREIDDVEEKPLYQDKYNYAVNYINEYLGENVDLTSYVVVEDISEQTEYIFKNDGEFVDTNRISTGAFGTDQAMSESLWRVVTKVDSGLAPIYGPRLMLLDRYVGGTWINTTVALHGTEEPERIGTPFGLGCFYHDNADIITLFDLLTVGTYVVAID